MGFFIRKSVSLGPLRFNLSKSGIGVSTGIRGLRVGSGPRGNYIHVGRGGLYYRHTLSNDNRAARAINRDSPDRVVASALESTHGAMIGISSGNASQMVDSSSAALLMEIQRKRERTRVFPIAVIAGIVALVCSAFAGAAAWMLILLVVVLLPLVAYAYYWDLFTKSVIMLYDIEDDFIPVFKSLCESIEAMSRCSAVWSVNAKADVYDPKYHAAADQLIQRKPISVHQHDPPFIRTNVSISCVPTTGGALYFLPDTILFFKGRDVGSISYDSIQIDSHCSNFIEEGRAPSDSRIVGQTWRYVNKKGGPDRRFNNNRELPICEYEDIRFRSNSGLNLLLQTSRTGIGSEISHGIKALAQSLDESKREEINPCQPSDNSGPSYSSNSAPAPADNERPRTLPLGDAHESLLRILCCVMASDGRASTSEKSRIRELMRKVGCSWDAAAVDKRIAAFVDDIQKNGYRAVVADSLSRISVFAAIGRQDIVAKCIDAVALSDGEESDRELAIIERIRSSLCKEN